MDSSSSLLNPFLENRSEAFLEGVFSREHKLLNSQNPKKPAAGPVIVTPSNQAASGFERLEWTLTRVLIWKTFYLGGFGVHLWRHQSPLPPWRLVPNAKFSFQKVKKMETEIITAFQRTWRSLRLG